MSQNGQVFPYLVGGHLDAVLVPLLHLIVEKPRKYMLAERILDNPALFRFLYRLEQVHGKRLYPFSFPLLHLHLIYIRLDGLRELVFLLYLPFIY